MPTGYTAFIENGKVKNGKDFLKLCTRAFGIFADYREDELSVELPTTHFETSNYYPDKLAEEEKKLKKLESLSDEEWQDMYNKAIESEKAEIDEQNEKNSEKYNAYAKILTEVMGTRLSEDYEKIRNFAIEQISESMEFCKPLDKDSYYYKRLNDLTNGGFEAYKKVLIEGSKRSISYYKEEYEKEKERTANRQKFIDGFLKEIGEK